MTTKGRLLPGDVIESWPEVFGEVKLNVIPLRYLQAVLVIFKDGKTWEIKITTKTKREGWSSFERTLSELYKTYEERIETIDFKLDASRVKKDIEYNTQKFLRKKKL